MSIRMDEGQNSEQTDSNANTQALKRDWNTSGRQWARGFSAGFGKPSESLMASSES